MTEIPKSRHHHEGKPPKFNALSGNSFGTCTCLHCMEEVSLDLAFNEYFHIFERIVEGFHPEYPAEDSEESEERS